MCTWPRATSAEPGPGGLPHCAEPEELGERPGRQDARAYQLRHGARMTRSAGWCPGPGTPDPAGLKGPASGIPGPLAFPRPPPPPVVARREGQRSLSQLRDGHCGLARAHRDRVADASLSRVSGSLLLCPPRTPGAPHHRAPTPAGLQTESSSSAPSQTCPTTRPPVPALHKGGAPPPD